MSLVARRLPNPDARHRRFVGAMWVLGLACLGALIYSFTLPLDWQTRLIVWILLTFLADEAGNWFGYSAIPLGVLPLLPAGTIPLLPLSAATEQWWIIFPLVATALLACLLMKHAGGPFVLPFAAALFALPILAAERLAPLVDPTIKFPANAQFQNLAFIAAGIGLLLSLIRQVAAAIIRQRQERIMEPEPRVVNLSKEG